MEHHLDDLDLGADAPGTDAKLLHLLTCPGCRSRAVRRLLEASVEADEDAPQVDYGPVLERLADVSPSQIEEARARRAQVERSFETLMGMPGEERLGSLADAPFQSLDFLDFLLEQSHARQLEAPALAAEIALLAAQLAANLAGEGEPATEPLLRALCLEANAVRLGGKVEEAEELLNRAAVFLETPDERAFYCRILALVRWEQGRPDEAAALLQYAEHLFTGDGVPGEQGACLALLGLLAAEEGREAEALPLLYRGWALLDRDLRPRLALRVALSLALCLAAAGQEEEARSQLREAWRLTPEVQDPGEMVRISGEEGRILGRLGLREESRQILESVVQALAAEGSFAEAVLLALDLVLLAEGGELDAIAMLIRSIEPAAPFSTAVALGLNALQALESCSAQGERELEDWVKGTRNALRRAFRACSVPMKPLPFA
jgi:tetratricopeptide (TPR) repeat protein